MRTNLKKLMSLAIMLVFTTVVLAQSTFKGKVVDAETGESIPGANITQQGTTNGASTDIDGNFTLQLSGKGKLTVSFIGYADKVVAFNAADGTNLGKITLSSDTQLLGEVVVVGSGIVDLAQDRKTPIAVSTINANAIEEKVGNSDLPELLKSTPSVQSIQKGGFGDGQMYLRGFDQTNTAFLLNGQPINGMEDGKMYWSNWTGVLDIANALQVQRGLGSSKLAISSVGGTVNIVTKTVDKKKGGFIRGMAGNDNYVKGTTYYSTGLMNNGWAVSAMFGHWQGDGYMQGAKGQGQTYFFSLGYKPNEKHIFNFLITGAPQWHGAAGGMKLQDYRDKGRRYSNWWGYKDGEVYPGGRNSYHKPIINLSWDWNMSERSTLSTVAYASFGRGSFSLGTGSIYGYRDSFGNLDYDAMVKDNVQNGKSNFVKSYVNSHNWYGMVTNFERKISDNWKLNFGVDGRFYNGIHYSSITDLLGASGVAVNSIYGGAYTIADETGYNPWKNTFSSTEHNERHSYDYEENINYMGAFGQLEYSTDRFSAFFQGAISNQSHKKTDYWNYTTGKESEKITNMGYNVKGGLSFSINENNIVFGNAGYYSRQPFHDDLFAEIRKSNELNPYGDESQKITGFELGYKFKSEFLSANLNLYHTSWDNRILASSKDTNDDGAADLFYQSSGVKELHKGVELELFTRITPKFSLDGFLSIGDWKYDGNVETRSYDEGGKLLTSGDIAYIDGVKIGNAAQFRAGVSGRYKILDNLSIDANYNYYDNLSSQISLSSPEYKKANNRGAIELPSYGIFDAGLSFEEPISADGKQSIKLRFNVNNLLDEFYIENSKTNMFAETGDETWKGVNTANKVYIGYGRTWNVSVTYKF